jgi:hypothetical protein
MASKRRLTRSRARSGRGNLRAVARPGRYDPNDRRYVATHEAGHAVAAVVLGIELVGVDLQRRRRPDGTTSLGFTNAPVPTRAVAGKGEAALPYVAQCLAGPLAEMAVNPGLLESSGGDAGDRNGARMIAAVAVCEAVECGAGRAEITPEELHRQGARIDGLMSAALAAACDLVNDNAPAIGLVAEALMERGRLSGAEVAAIVNAERSRVPDGPPAGRP